MPFDTEEQALTLDKEQSPHYLSLKGTWAFHWAENPDKRCKDFHKADADIEGFGTIQVPGHWQLQGYDYPQYVNTRYPWIGHDDIEAPFAPTRYNPVGQYRKVVELPDAFLKKPVYFRLEGVESAFYLWVNGDFVGYAEDSFTASEFDLTPYLQPGKNIFAIEVYRWSDGSWLEGQDFWRMSGIFRDLYLYCLPEVHIDDFFIRASLDDDYQDGKLAVDAALRNYNETPGTATLLAKLYDRDLALVATAEKKVAISGEQQDVSLQMALARPRHWSAEDPYLYKLTLSLLDDEGRTTEVEGSDVGFRRFELKDGLMQLNGKPILFKGVNRHEFDSRVGRAITKVHMLQDIRMIKKANINAVRTSHYPNDPYWYKLCDRYGVYLMDEVNLETHGTWHYGQKELGNTLPGSRPEWRANVLDRCSAMFERDKNHPSILVFSLGNESFGGDNFQLMHDYFKEKDASRLVHYEGVFHYRLSEGVSDMESTMYIPPEQVETYAKQAGPGSKPYILCEFSHAMGNSLGNFQEYVALFDKYPILQGGFIWDFKDQALLHRTQEGVPFLAYGGDFGEWPHDGTFSGNGIVFADGTPSPKLAEVRRQYQPAAFEAVDLSAGTLRIRNKFLFTSLDRFLLKWQMLKDGEPAVSGTLPLDLAPGEAGIVSLDYVLPQEPGEARWDLQVSLRQTEATLYAEQGHEVAFGEFLLPVAAGPVVRDLPEGAVSCSLTEGMWQVTAADATYSFDPAAGLLIGIGKAGFAYLETPVVPDFWRALTDNDRGNGLEERAGVFRHAAGKMQLLSATLERGATMAAASFTHSYDGLGNSRSHTCFAVRGDGLLEIDFIFRPDPLLPDIPAIGLAMTASSGLDRLEWVGRGPHESYADRWQGARIGRWSGTVREQFVPYLRPQACGNKMEVTKLSVHGARHALDFTSRLGFEAVVLPYTDDELEAAGHPHELPEAGKTVVKINLGQMGVGGDDSWGQMTHPAYRLHPNQVYRHQFMIRLD
ncbi:DUF4981 domain-containing protein [Clostridiales bacterium F-3ap]|uniref:Beta-galactosidase n=2 Tax=Anaerotalea alkaliphila TaxID=2662126 RepID=A0A7X5HUS9_9FIRM|nr:DUF4981 domain-containing protein [Anaerotalea alkaliphila]